MNDPVRSVVVYLGLAIGMCLMKSLQLSQEHLPITTHIFKGEMGYR